MHIDRENLALSVLKTSKALEWVYEQNGAKSTIATDLFRIHLLQYVLNENSQYSAQIREQALGVLREKIEKKESVGLGNIETDPHTVSKALDNISADLHQDLTQIYYLIDAPNLDLTLKDWNNFLVLEKQLEQKYKNINPHWIHQLESLLGSGSRKPVDGFENQLYYIFIRQVDYIKYQLRLGNDMEQSRCTAEKHLLDDVRFSFMHALEEIAKVCPIEPLAKHKVSERFEKSLQNYSASTSFTAAVDEYRNKEEPIQVKDWINTIHK